MGGFDSWLKVTCDNKTVLNLNDCRVDTAAEVRELKNKVGKVDVLMTQFGWANWVGNRRDTRAIQTTRNKVLHRSDNQLKILQPEFVIPFASFCWFSHVENAFCNNNCITIQEFIERYPDENVITLYLDDEWVVGEQKDCSSGVVSWMKALDNIRAPKWMSREIDAPSLQKSFLAMQNKIQEANNWEEILLLKEEGILEGCTIYLTDINKALLFDITADSLIATYDQPDILMSSESLDYLMKHAWGRGTLTINGRFSANYDTFYKFLRQTHIYYANNIGKHYPETIKKEEIVNPKSFVHDLAYEEKNNVRRQDENRSNWLRILGQDCSQQFN